MNGRVVNKSFLKYALSTLFLSTVCLAQDLPQDAVDADLHPTAPYLYVDWESALGGQTIRFGRWFKNDRQMMAQIKKRYEAINPTQLEPQEEPIIPKKIHQIWIGGPLPKKYEQIRKTWQDMHPDWEYKLWTDDDAARLEMRNCDLFEAATNIGQKADILRCEVLNQFGGLYVDMDFECLKPFDILNHTYSFYTGLNHTRIFELANGLIACTPGHPLMKRLIENISITGGGYPGWRQNVIITTGPAFFTKHFMAYIHDEPDDRVIAFPTTYFYPMRSLQRFRWEDRLNFAKPESFGIHYFHHAWWKRQ